MTQPPVAPPDGSATDVPAARRSLFRDRNFALLFGGQAISDFGTAVTSVAFPLVAIVALHATAFEVGVVAAASNAAWLVVTLPAGAIIDRVRRRPVLIGTDLARAVLLASVPLAWAFHVLAIGQLIAVAFAVSVASVVFDIAYPAFLPAVVTPARLVEANGALETSVNSAFVAGPGLGGLLVQFVGAPVTLIADSVSYLVSAATLSGIRVAEPHAVDKADAPARRSMMRDIAEGMRYVMRHRLTSALVVALTCGNFVLGGYTAVVVVFLARQLGLKPGVIGVLFAVGAIGGVLGALCSGPIARRIGDARVLWVAALVNLPAALLIPVASRGAGIAWFIAGQVLLYFALAMFNVCGRAALQGSAPPRLLGRVTASIRVFSRSALPLGSLAGGTLAAVFTPRVALISVFAGFVLVPLRLFFSPIGKVRSVAELNATGAAAAV